MITHVQGKLHTWGELDVLLSIFSGFFSVGPGVSGSCSLAPQKGGRSEIFGDDPETIQKPLGDVHCLFSKGS